jgi:hypothetical protein
METQETKETRLETIYRNYTDEQLREVLIKRKNYRPEAVELAVKLAIERGLIHSEQDLIAPEFQDHSKRAFTLFPDIQNEQSRKRTHDSAFRVLFIAGVVPLAFGAIRFAEGNLPLTILSVVAGLVWEGLLFALLKMKKTFWVFLLQLWLTIVLIGAVAQIGQTNQITFTDAFITGVFYLMATYLLFFIRKLIKNK